MNGDNLILWVLSFMELLFQVLVKSLSRSFIIDENTRPTYSTLLKFGKSFAKYGSTRRWGYMQRLLLEAGPKLTDVSGT